MTDKRSHMNKYTAAANQDSISDINVAAENMRTMHTRLADLLDSVSVTSQVDNGEDDHGELSTTSSSWDASPLSKPLSSFVPTQPAEPALNGQNQPEAEHDNGDMSSYFSSFSPKPLDTPASTNTPVSTDMSGASNAFELSDGVALSETPISNGISAVPDATIPSEDSATLINPPDANQSEVNGTKSVMDKPFDSEKEVLSDSLTESSSGAIVIKGRTDGLSIEIGAGSWRMLMAQLRTRLQQSSGFFRGGSVSLDVGSRSLSDEELNIAKDVLNEHGLNLNLVRSSSEQTSQSAGLMGIAVNLDRGDGTVAQAASTNHDSLAHFVYRGNLRSGQILRRSETILVLGDVNPGAQVISEHDVLVWGRLRGIAHAGATGDEQAIISAMLMEPTQLRISEAIAIMPDADGGRGLFGRKKRAAEAVARPEIAYLEAGTIIVEPWDDSKPGGIMAYRRS